MKTKLCLIASLLALASPPCAARLNETVEECVARYGEPVSRSDTILIFVKNGYNVAASFHAGRCESIFFSKAVKDAGGLPLKLQDGEISALLAANSGTSEWALEKKPWATTDGKLTAVYDEDLHRLSIMTADGIARRAAGETAAKIPSALKGF